MYNFIGLIISFFWFYRRVILGLILLAGLGFWIHRVTNMSMYPDVESEDELGRQRSLEPKIPKANIDFGSAKERPSFGGPGEKRFADVLLDPFADQEIDAENDANRDSPSADETFNDPGQVETFLANATVDELIEESLNLRDTWGSASQSVGMLMCARRAKISRRLLEMKLTDAQHIFATTSYIESISLVDSLNVASKMKMVGPRAALIEIDETYSDHPDPAVRAKANLAMVLAPIYECMATEDVEAISVIQREFDERFDKIVADQASVSRLAEVSLALNNNRALKSAAQPYLSSLLQRLSQSESPKILEMGKILKERLLYDKFDLASLPGRLDVEDPAMRATVQEFFETLAANPDSRTPIYQAAVTTIVKYLLLGKTEDANALIDWLEQIAQKTTDEENKRQIDVAIEKMRKK